jgi:hypothetical protein
MKLSNFASLDDPDFLDYYLPMPQLHGQDAQDARDT